MALALLITFLAYGPAFFRLLFAYAGERDFGPTFFGAVIAGALALIGFTLLFIGRRTEYPEHRALMLGFGFVIASLVAEIAGLIFA